MFALRSPCYGFTVFVQLSCLSFSHPMSGYHRLEYQRERATPNDDVTTFLSNSSSPRFRTLFPIVTSATRRDGICSMLLWVRAHSPFSTLSIPLLILAPFHRYSPQSGSFLALNFLRVSFAGNSLFGELVSSLYVSWKTYGDPRY